MQPDKHKQLIMDSLRFLVEDKRIWLYGFVIMPNHIHLLWRKQDAWLNKNIQQIFLKFIAHQLKFSLMDNNPEALAGYKSTQGDRDYHFWERRPWRATMYNREVAKRKMDYIHWNPVKAGLCKLPEDYHFSSACYYELNVDDWKILTHYMEHL